MDADAVIKPGTLCVVVGSDVLESILGRFVTVSAIEQWHIAMALDGRIVRILGFEVAFVGEPPKHPFTAKADWVVRRRNLLPINDPGGSVGGPATARIPEIEAYSV